MKISLNDKQQRVLGSLMEKQMSTPEQYPLSMNALLNACNQKNNRDPVVQWDEADLRKTVNSLMDRKMVMQKEEKGSRVPKYAQRLAGGEFSELKLSSAEMAILCELLLRGPQTPGELRSRCGRLFQFESLAQLEDTLNRLCDSDRGPLLQQLPKEPGKRERRYVHLLQRELVADAVTTTEPASMMMTEVRADDRLEALEQRLRALELRVQQLELAAGKP